MFYTCIIMKLFFLQFTDNTNSDQQAETMHTGMCLNDKQSSISLTKNIFKKHV